MNDFFLHLTILTATAAVISILLKFIKQPPVLAYILTGILFSQLVVFDDHTRTSISSFADIGITLLLFILGLELRMGELRSVGKTAVYVGFMQIFCSSGIAFLLSNLLGFSLKESIYLGIGLTLSSTIVIVKLLSDKKEMASLHGKISVGILLVQDLFAILTLVVLSGFSQSATIKPEALLIVALKAAALFITVGVTSQFLFPKIVRMLSKSQELLFLCSIAWAFSVSAIVSSEAVGFSIEIGGLLAGIALAEAVESTQIVAKIRALRDFFIVLFFVNLGLKLQFGDIKEVLLPSIILIIFVLFVKPLIVMSLLGLNNYKKHTSFFTGISFAQVSEFSIILILIGFNLGHVSQKVVSIVALVSIIGFITSAFFILQAELLFKFLRPYLNIFERKSKKRGLFTKLEGFNKHIVIIGGHRLGRCIIETLKNGEKDLVAIDFDPDIIAELEKEGVNTLFGDIIDVDIQEKANLDKASIVFSSLPNYEDNLIIAKTVRAKNKKTIIILNAHSHEDAEDLKKSGANYVVRPYEVAGKSLGKIIKKENWEHL